MWELGDKISCYRQNVNMTQEELAAKLGVTAQAISKWERKQSYPDIVTFAQLCRILNISADILLETEFGNFSGFNDSRVNNEVRRILRGCEEPLVLEFGQELLDVFLTQEYVKYFDEQRRMMARTGMLMPIIQIRDNFTLNSNEFMVLSYHRILYSGYIDSVHENTCRYIVEKTAETIRSNYGYILNRDMVKMIVENLKLEYPALITGVIPEKISYGLLQKVLKGLLKRGDGLCYMVKTIETLEDELERQPDISADELICAVAKEIEREDNFYVVMEKRRQEAKP